MWGLRAIWRGDGEDITGNPYEINNRINYGKLPNLINRLFAESCG